MTILALGVAGYSAAVLSVPAWRTGFLQDVFANTPVAAPAHLFGGSIALALGAFQLNTRLRNRYLSAHRWLGRVYVPAVMIGGIAGLILAIEATGGLVSKIGFGMMAVCWLGTTAAAYVQIRAGNVQAHRVWMIRSYALTLAAVTLRIYLPMSQIYGLEFESAYQAISWLCWVPNLLIAEWFFLQRR